MKIEQESRALLQYTVRREPRGDNHRPNWNSHFHPVLCLYPWGSSRGREFSDAIYIIAHIPSDPVSDSLQSCTDAKRWRIDASAERLTSNFDGFSSVLFNSSCELCRTARNE